MILKLDDPSNLPLSVLGGALTIGNFDGVHRGHRSIVDQVRRLADQVSGPAIVFTFDPPPARLLRPNEAPEALTDIERRAELLTKLGIDFVVVCPTTIELLQLEAEDFFERIVVQTLRAKAIAEGENFRFGKQRRGDIVMLQQLCTANQLRFQVLQPQLEQGEWISSSRIRHLIEAGLISSANELLTERYQISGTVGQGAARGRTLGFPTANLENIPVLLPPLGVYAGRVVRCTAATGAKKLLPNNSGSIGLPVAMNIGPNPTFGEQSLKVEAHVIGFQGDLYDTKLTIELVDKLRDVRKFESKDQLLAQIATDIDRARSLVAASCGK